MSIRMSSLRLIISNSCLKLAFLSPFSSLVCLRTLSPRVPAVPGALPARLTRPSLTLIGRGQGSTCGSAVVCIGVWCGSEHSSAVVPLICSGHWIQHDILDHRLLVTVRIAMLRVSRWQPVPVPRRVSLHHSCAAGAAHTRERH